MNKFFEKVDLITECVGTFFLSVMCLVIFIQVICRYCFNNALAWPEEVARFSFIWATYFGISMCMKGDRHLRINLLSNYLNHAMERYVNIFCMFLNCVFFAICIYLSFDFTLKIYDLEQIAVSFPLPIWIVWLGIPLGLGCTLLQSGKNLWDSLYKA